MVPPISILPMNIRILMIRRFFKTGGIFANGLGLNVFIFSLIKHLFYILYRKNPENCFTVRSNSRFGTGK